MRVACQEEIYSEIHCFENGGGVVTEQDLELIRRKAGQSLPQGGLIARATTGQPERRLTNSKTHRCALQLVGLRAIKRPHSWETIAFPFPFDNLRRRNLGQCRQATPEDFEPLQ